MVLGDAGGALGLWAFAADEALRVPLGSAFSSVYPKLNQDERDGDCAHFHRPEPRDDAGHRTRAGIRPGSDKTGGDPDRGPISG